MPIICVKIVIKGSTINDFFVVRSLNFSRKLSI